MNIPVDDQHKELQGERREYLRSGNEGVHQDELNKDPITQFETWLIDAKNSQIKDPTAMMLATVDETGQPSQRTVLLKGFDHSGFVFYTNLSSKKAQDIKQNQKVSLIFPWLNLERQVIISGTAQKLSLKENAEYFLSRPKESQIAAWISEQSSPISNKQLLMSKFEEMKQKFADKDLSLPEFWGGYKIVPHRFEFWSGSANRLHDRFEYTLNASNGTKEGQSNWSIQRLQP